MELVFIAMETRTRNNGYILQLPRFPLNKTTNFLMVEMSILQLVIRQSLKGFFRKRLGKHLNSLFFTLQRLE